MGCKVEVYAECQVETKDPKGTIIGLEWKKDVKEAKKDQLVRVVAKMTGTCKAMIVITHYENKRDLAQLHLKNTPPKPKDDECTMYKEVIYWADLVNKGGKPELPSATFTARASCGGECGECDEKEHSANCTQAFNDV
jgi:hypothetical protein